VKNSGFQWQLSVAAFSDRYTHGGAMSALTASVLAAFSGSFFQWQLSVKGTRMAVDVSTHASVAFGGSFQWQLSVKVRAWRCDVSAHCKRLTG
jgi:hypothetical protein